MEFKPGFWWSRKLLSSFQGVVLVSGIQEAALTSVGVEGFCQKCETEYGFEERGKNSSCDV